MNEMRHNTFKEMKEMKELRAPTFSKKMKVRCYTFKKMKELKEINELRALTFSKK